MNNRATDMKSSLAGREGFVMPAVVFALAIMGILAVAGLRTGDDEQRSSRALRESGVAFYVAEAGLNVVWATWPNSAVAALTAGDSLDLGWTALANGGSYRAVIHRYDNGGQKIFELVVEGRAPGPRGGQRVLSRALTLELPFEITGAVEGEGSALVKDNSWVDGEDTTPTGWTGVCPGDKTNLAGATWDDPSKVTVQSPPAGFKGNPATQGGGKWPFDDQAWADWKSKATIHITNGQLSPTPVVSGGVCNTSVNTNWGSDDPTNACFDYFPIILLDGASQFADKGYGQGILLVEGTLKFNASDRMTFNGLILVKGCITVKDADIRGAIAVDGQASCSGGDFNDGVIVSDNTNVNWSSCAAIRAVEGSGSASVKSLSQGSFVQVLR